MAWKRGRQLFILLWKNFLLQMRRPIGTVLELLVPPVACAVVIALRFTLFEVQNRCHLTFDPDPLTLPVPFNAYHIYYSPNTSQAAREVAAYLSSQETYWSVVGVASEQELVDRLTTLSPPPPPITLTNEYDGINATQNVGCFVAGAGVVFDSLEAGDGLEYTLRLRHEVGEMDTWHTREASFWFQEPGARVTDNAYLAEGFLHLQNRVARAIINWKAAQLNKTTPRVQVSVKQIPYPSYRIDEFLNWNAAILPLLLIMAFIYSAGMFTKELVLEKETRIRESMLMMGLQQWVLWTTWFIKQFIFLLVSSIIVTLLLKFGQVFPESNIFLLLLFFTLFATASISWGFFVSVWFSSARLGMVVSFVAWFFIYIPFFYVPQNYHVFPLPAKLVMCVLTNTCMGIGITLVSEWEVRQQGLTVDTLLQPLTIEDDFHMGWVLFMLALDTLLFITVAWYINEVKPGRYGIPKPFYFPLLPSYWTGRQCRTTHVPHKYIGSDNGHYLHEEEPQDMKVGISIRNLVKIYNINNISCCKCCGSNDDEARRRKLAVDGLSLNMYEGQITALLGHNGAGKTTTISILTGLYTPTSGTAVINGYDIRTNMDQIRHSLGICPQHNVLFDRLTVLEHLRFFARLKGVKGKALKEEVEGMLEDLQLQDKRNTPSRNLSGGMKRKLSVGIALIGGSKIVVLDEPTSGIDPYARRAIWDLLSKHREGRTMLLTTHFMDEADLLGDRIAIMAEGKLRCSGSSLFLKSRYGVGYHMVIVKEPYCDSRKVCDLVLGKVPGSQVVTDVGAELSFILPSTATHHFPPLFDTLEVEQDGLGVSSYGISMTTMEEVFMKVREGEEETLKERLERSVSAGTLSALPTAPPSPSPSPPSHHSPLSHYSQSPWHPRTVVELHRTECSVDSLNSISAGSFVQKTMSREEVREPPTEDRSLERGDVRNERYPRMYGVSWGRGDRVMGDCCEGRYRVTSESETRAEVCVSEQLQCGDVVEVGGVCVSESETRAEVSVGEQCVDVVEVGGVCVSESGDDVIAGDGTGGDSEEESVNVTPTMIAYLPPPTNRGLVLRLQRYRGMLVKRIYVSVRFWQAMITQLVLPILFVVYAMVLAKTILFTDDASDPRRSLGVSESSLGANRTFFWAEFGRGGGVEGGNLAHNDPSFFDFTAESVLADSLGATDLHNYTGRVLDLVSTAVHSGRDTEQCCDYPYQMLDKHCASRSQEELMALCGHKSSFPYHYCTRCLSCCTSRETRLPSCTHPLTQNTNYQENEFCPSSPQTSILDLRNNLTIGRLDTYTAYVDELLMRLSHDITAPVFTRRVMGGFIVQRVRDPPYSACGCATPRHTCENIFGILLPCGANDSSRSIYLAPLFPVQGNSCPGLNSVSLSLQESSEDTGSGNSSSSNNSGSGSSDDGGSGASGDDVMRGCGSLEFEPGYEVDGFGADILNAETCNVSSGCGSDGVNISDMISAQYYPELEETLTVTVWYNNRPWHMSAAALNAFHNVWLRQATDNNDLRLTVNNHPLPRTSLNNLGDVEQANLDGYYVGLTVVFGYSFLVASFVLVLVAEKENKAKHLQFVSGADVTSFWLANLTWDLINSLLPVTISVAVIAASQVEAYSGPIPLAAIACLLLLTCWSSISIVYSVSFLFTNSLIAFGIILVSFFLSCLIFFLVTLVIPDELIKDALHYVFLVNPAYTLGIGLNDVYINYFLRAICTFTPLAQQSCDLNDIRYVDNLFSFERPGIGLLLLYMAVEGLVFFILTLIIERHFFSKEVSKACRRNGSKKKATPSDDVEMTDFNQPKQDSDVQEEARKVQDGQADNSAIIIQTLVKIYPRTMDGFKMRPAKLAVQGISVAIPTGECFGLLGVNGAGKTTTFNILIGDISPSSGTAIISGYDIRTDLRKVRQLIGYCPQFDALIERMTGRELLTMFARLRGIPERLISQAVEAEVVRLDLTKHASKQCGKYSGGNKRKLSTAIALIGDPSIILLDEPTTGMDPATRRYLWDVLTGVTREGRSIVLTSHSMEECEALCTRLAIMVNGQFKCLGSIQHLKNKYGSGYTLQAKVGRDCNARQLAHNPSQDSLKVGTPSPSPRGRKRSIKGASSASQIHLNQFNTDQLHTFIKNTFPGALLMEEHQGAVTYQLCSTTLRWATVFREIEQHRDRLGVTDYSVSQTTLEQVFVNFAKDQAEVEQAT